MHANPAADPCHKTYPQFIFFGDSITEFGEPTPFFTTLRHSYRRCVDIVNRGFSGYTSRMALATLPQFLPTPDQPGLKLLVVFFGANDACLPGEPQHVPLQTYVECLEAILDHDCVQAHGRELRRLLVVPSPVDEWGLTFKSEGGGLSRLAGHTKKYGDACRDVGRRKGVPVVDLWQLFMTAAGWTGDGPLPGSRDGPKNDLLARLLPDGRFSPPLGVASTRQGHQN